LVVRLLASRCAVVVAWAAASLASAQPVVLEGIRGIDQHGRLLSAPRLAGHPVLLHFVFTGCSTSCPTQLAELAEVHRSLPAAARSRLRFVSVSVDPLTDTPQALATFARRFGADREGWIFLTGKPGSLEPLYERMRVFDPGKPAALPEDHRTSLYLYGADGRLLQRFRGVPVDRARLIAELARL
jgi:protein SCO1